MGRRKGPRITGGPTHDSGSDADALLAALNLGGDEPTFYDEAQERTVEIAAIRPDPMQPRRAMPEGLRAEWIKGTPIASLFLSWSETAAKDFDRFGLAPNWALWLEPAQDGTPLDDTTDLPFTASTRSWIALLRLAASIYQNGLEVPVSVYPLNRQTYRLLVGERRLLAFNLLHVMFELPEYERIPALVREGYNPLRQAVENGARKNLNAISTARQLSLLLMALNNMMPQIDEQPDQAFYAQGADVRVPHGKTDLIATALGLPNASMIRKYRRLLTLPPIVWQWADQFDWPEGKVRSLLSKAGDDTDLLIQLANAEMQKEIGETPQQVAMPAKRVSQQTVSRAVGAMRKVVDLDRRSLKALDVEDQRELLRLAHEIVGLFE